MRRDRKAGGEASASTSRGRGGVTRAFVGLGSNEGDRLALLQSAASRIRAGALAMTWLSKGSSIYETRPLGPSEGNFLNAAVELRTLLDPVELVEGCLRIEKEHGRVRGARWAARTLDVDLLLVLDPAAEGTTGAAWISRTATSPRATVPHPRLLDRDFVLAPLCDLIPDEPVLQGRTPRERLTALPRDARTIVRRLEQPLLSPLAVEPDTGDEGWA